jgi:hypothetical protein
VVLPTPIGLGATRPVRSDFQSFSLDPIGLSARRLAALVIMSSRIDLMRPASVTDGQAWQWLVNVANGTCTEEWNADLFKKIVTVSEEAGLSFPIEGAPNWDDIFPETEEQLAAIVDTVQRLRIATTSLLVADVAASLGLVHEVLPPDPEPSNGPVVSVEATALFPPMLATSNDTDAAGGSTPPASPSQRPCVEDRIPVEMPSSIWEPQLPSGTMGPITPPSLKFPPLVVTPPATPLPRPALVAATVAAVTTPPRRTTPSRTLNIHHHGPPVTTSVSEPQAPIPIAVEGAHRLPSPSIVLRCAPPDEPMGGDPREESPMRSPVIGRREPNAARRWNHWH